MQIITAGKKRYEFPDEVTRDQIESIIDRDNKGLGRNEDTGYAGIALDLAKPTVPKMQSLGIGAAKAVGPSAAFLGGMGAGVTAFAPFAAVPVVGPFIPVVAGLAMGAGGAWAASTVQEAVLDKVLSEDTKKFITDKALENPGYTTAGRLLGSGFRPSLTIEKTLVEAVKNRGAPAALSGAITAGTEVFANRNEPGLMREGAMERIMDAAAEGALLNKTTGVGQAVERLGSKSVPDRLVKTMGKFAPPPRPVVPDAAAAAAAEAATAAETAAAEAAAANAAKRNDAAYEDQLREEGRAEGADTSPVPKKDKNEPPPTGPEKSLINKEFNKQEVIERDIQVAELAEEARVKAIQELQQAQRLGYQQRKEGEFFDVLANEPPPSNVVAGPDAPLENLIGTRVKYGEITGILVVDSDGRIMVMPEIRDKNEPFWYEVEGGGNARGDPDIRAGDLRIVPLEPAKATVKRPPEVPPIPVAGAATIPVPNRIADVPPRTSPEELEFGRRDSPVQDLPPVQELPAIEKLQNQRRLDYQQTKENEFLAEKAMQAEEARVNTEQELQRVKDLEYQETQEREFLASKDVATPAEIPRGPVPVSSPPPPRNPFIAPVEVPTPMAGATTSTEANLKLGQFADPRIPTQKLPPRVAVDPMLVQDVAEQKVYLDELLATREITPELHAEEISRNERRLTDPVPAVASPVVAETSVAPAAVVKPVSEVVPVEVAAIPMASAPVTAPVKKASPAPAATAVAKVPNAESYSKKSLKSAFNLTDKQATATDILVKSMGLDESKILVTKGGKAGKGSLKQVEGILSGEEKAPKFETREEAVKFIKDYASKNRVIPKGLKLMSSEGKSTAVDAIVKHTLRELAAWKKVSKDYIAFYTTDIVARTNPKLQENALKQYGRKLTNSEIAFNHLLSAFGSGQSNPSVDTAMGMRVFDEYMRTGRATGYTDKPKPIYKAPAVGKAPIPVYVDSKTGADTFVSRGNSQKFDSSRKSQVSRTYNVSGLERFNSVMDHFKGNLDSTMEWLGSQHTWPEITEVIGPKAANSLKSHEYLNKNGETFGVFTLGNNPKLGSYILNRWQNLSTITKDMWVARTMSRFFGEPNTGIPWATTTVGRNKRVILDEAWGKVAKELGVEPAQIQEMMWDAEKRFYGILGQATGAEYTSSGVEMARRLRGDSPLVGDGMSPSEGTVLRQGTKGAYELTSDGKAIIRGFESADVSTAAHEIAHVARRQLLDRNLKPEQRAGITDSDISYAETWSGAKKGVWDKSADEKFARGFEKYLRDGKAPTEGLQSVFSKFADWLSGIYQTLVGSAIDIRVSPKMKLVFDQMVTRSERLKLESTPALGGANKLPMSAKPQMGFRGAGDTGAIPIQPTSAQPQRGFRGTGDTGAIPTQPTSAKPRGSFPSARDRGAINLNLLSSLGQSVAGGTVGFAAGYNQDPDASTEDKVVNGIMWGLFGASLGSKYLRGKVFDGITKAKIPLGLLSESMRKDSFGGADNFVLFTKGVLTELQTVMKNQSNETAALAYKALQSLDALEGMRGKVPDADWNAAMAHLGNGGSPSLIADRKLQSAVKIVRTEIDDFGLDLLGRGYVLPGSDLEAKILFNNGKYLTRVYELFTNPDFKPDPKLRDKVIDEYVAQAKAEGRKEPTNELEIEGLKFAIDIVAKGEGSALAPKGANLAMGNGYARTDGSIFKPRKNLSDTIAKYMGRIDDPLVAAGYTIDRLAHFIGASITQSKMAEVGLDMGLFSRTADKTKYTVKLSDLSAEATRGPLAPLYTTPEVSDALRTLSAYGKNGAVVRILASTTGMMRLANTAGNIESFPPNGIGSVVAVLAQGSAVTAILNPRKIGTALKLSFNDVLPVTGTLSNDIPFFIREGVLGPGVNAQEIMETFKKSAFSNMGRSSNSVLFPATNVVRKVGSGVLKGYSMMEEIPRLVGFYAEVNKYSDALYNKLPEQLTTIERLEVYKKAATIIRENYPNRAEVPELIRSLSTAGVLPPFVAFSYEAFIRTPYNTVLRAKAEIVEGSKTGNKKLAAIGVKRLSFFIGTMYGSLAIAAAISKKQGLSEDQEKDARYFMPTWDKTSPLVFPEFNGDEIAYANQSYLNPQAVMGKAISDALKGKTFLETVGSFYDSVVNTFISDDAGLLFGPMFEAVSGRDSQGRKVYTENRGGLYDVSKMSPKDQETSIARQQLVERYIIHGFKNVVPRTIKVVDKYIKALNEEVGPNGEVYKIADRNARLMGLRINRMDVATAARYKAASLSGEMSEADNEFSTARKAKDATDKSKDVAYNNYEQQRYRVWLKMQEYLEHGTGLGRPQQELLDNLKGVDTRTKMGLLTDVYTPANKDKTLSARDRLEALQNYTMAEQTAEWAFLDRYEPREARKLRELIREDTRKDLRGLTGTDTMLAKLDSEDRAKEIAIQISRIPDQNKKQMEWDRLGDTGLLRGDTGMLLKDPDRNQLIWAEARAVVERNLKRNIR